MSKTQFLALSAVLAAGLQACSNTPIPPPEEGLTPDQALVWISERLGANCNKLGFAAGSASYDQCYWYLASQLGAALSEQQISFNGLPAALRDPNYWDRRLQDFRPGQEGTFTYQDRIDDWMVYEDGWMDRAQADEARGSRE